MVARVQQNQVEGSGSARTIALLSAATAGRVLFAGLGYNKNAGTIGVNVADGWVILASSSTTDVSIAIAMKASAHGDARDECDWTMTNSNQHFAWIAEYSGFANGVTTPKVSTNYNAGTNRASIAMGAQTTDQNSVCIAMFAVDTWGGTGNFTNSFAQVSALGGSDAGGSWGERLNVANATSVSTTMSGTSAFSDQCSGIMVTAGEALSSGQTVALGQASESESATAAVEHKAEATGAAGETEQATASGEAKAEGAGQAVESEVATAAGEGKARATGQASESETATAAVERKAEAAGQAVEGEQAQSVTVQQTPIAHQATESESATAAGEAKSKTVGQASETEQARPTAEAKSEAVGQAGESETARPTAEAKAEATGRATETEQAQAATERKTVTLGQAVESEQAPSVLVPPAPGVVVLTRNLFVARARALGALGLLYAPESDEEVVTDLSGEGHDGLLVNGAALGSGIAYEAAAAALDGSNDYIDTRWETRTNLVRNPSAEGGQETNALTTVVVSATLNDFSGSFFNVEDGTRSFFMQATALAAPAGGVATAAVEWQGSLGSPNLARMPVVEGLEYTASAVGCYIASKPAQGQRFYVGFYDAAGALLLSVGGAPVPTTGDQVPPPLTATAPPGAVAARMFFGNIQSVAGPLAANEVSTFWIDGLMFTAQPGPYFPTVEQVAAGVAGFAGLPWNAESDMGPFARGTARTFVLLTRRDSGGTDDGLFGASATSGSGNTALAELKASGDVVWTAKASGAATTWAAAAAAAGVTRAYAVTHDDDGNDAILHVDGTLVSSQVNGVMFAGSLAGRLQVGGRTNGTIPFHGKVLPFAVFLRALTDAEHAFLIDSRPAARERWRARVDAGEVVRGLPVTYEVTTPDEVDGSSGHAPGLDLGDELAAGGGLIVTASPRVQDWLDGSPLVERS